MKSYGKHALCNQCGTNGVVELEGFDLQWRRLEQKQGTLTSVQFICPYCVEYMLACGVVPKVRRIDPHAFPDHEGDIPIREQIRNNSRVQQDLKFFLELHEEKYEELSKIMSNKPQFSFDSIKITFKHLMPEIDWV